MYTSTGKKKICLDPLDPLDKFIDSHNALGDYGKMSRLVSVSSSIIPTNGMPKNDLLEGMSKLLDNC